MPEGVSFASGGWNKDGMQGYVLIMDVPFLNTDK